MVITRVCIGAGSYSSNERGNSPENADVSPRGLTVGSNRVRIQVLHPTHERDAVCPSFSFITH